MRASPRVAVGGAPTLPTKTSVTQSHPSVNSWMGFFVYPSKKNVGTTIIIEQCLFRHEEAKLLGST